MQIVTDIAQWRNIRKSLSNSSIGFVPTMGNLHLGHLSLCQRAQAETSLVIVSIFVNPTQFNQAADFQHYPRTLEQDITLLKDVKVDYLLVFNEDELYPDKFEIQLHETTLSSELEGAHRPGHFTGMLTIVLKLFNLVQPTHAYFGEKDYQQLLLIQKMVASLFLPIAIISCPTVRDKDGLALSSRNSRLNPAQRQKAIFFAPILQKGNTITEIQSQLEDENIQIDYIADKWNRRLAAVWLEDIRLIDNIPLE